MYMAMYGCATDNALRKDKTWTPSLRVCHGAFLPSLGSPAPGLFHRILHTPATRFSHSAGFCG
jgi:hypothetical protein